ncbi:alginate lyase family protein [Desulfobacter postgatei]|uniref:alginate lyase family protein n=1 Tax=Desulfobacter postgatei TaxID=2293 RepID=UPI001FDF41FD|nr:alginate lyase family protein [Desulfobacter postgatei]
MEKAKKITDKRKSFKYPERSTLFAKTIYLLSKYADAEQLKEQFPDTLEKHFAWANAALTNRFVTFGLDVIFGKKVDWHFDLASQKSWPSKFWGDINIRDKSKGGVKFVWEFNRLYFLFSMGLCYKLTQEKKYANHIGKTIRSWNKDNPYPIGVNWTSGIEAGVRLANLVWSLSFLENYDLPENDLKAVNIFVWFHASHLHRYPSKYSSANNHLLAEAFGLFLAGVYFPHLPGAAKWLEHGKRILDAEVGRQILPDGGSFEYSTTYLSFVFDFFLLYRQMCICCGLKYEALIDERLKKSCDFINSIMDEKYNIPNIGDQDSAVLVHFGLSNLENFISILNTGSVLFNEPGMARSSTDLKTWLLTGKDSSFSRDTSPKNEQIALHKPSGLSVIRDHINSKEVLFIGNGTKMGMAPLYAHGHLDALSFTLSVAGKSIFMDTGTYLYHNSGKWREYFRSTAAHNTIRLNKTDLSKQIGDFMFGKPYEITKNTLKKTDSHITWNASHDAYLRKSPFTEIGREVVWRKQDQKFTITDNVNAKSLSPIELFFHFHPDCLVEKENGSVFITRGNIKISLEHDPLFNADLFFGSDDPLFGWYSPEFNKISPCFTIRLQGICSKNFKCTTTIHIHSSEEQ